MRKILNYFFVTFCFASGASYSAILSNHEAPNYDEVPACRSALHALSTETKQHSRKAPATTEDQNSVRVLSWNIEKGFNLGWEEDLREFAADADFILLQEAVLKEEMQSPQDRNLFWSFSKGYTTDHYTSGVLIASQLQPVFTCTLHITEPWLRSPKSSLLSYFTQKNGQSLVVVNLHAINFTLGVEEFHTQLASIESILEDHSGQLIIAGDFNTWNNERRQLLDEFSATLKLKASVFQPDDRTYKFGHALDHVFFRNFDMASAQVQSVNTSDHNPLNVVLHFKDRSSDSENLVFHQE